LKTTFNEKVLSLRLRKISLIHDYKQFKFDACMIQKEFNDLEITTPSNFPDVVMDESIDVSNNIILYKIVKYSIVPTIVINVFSLLVRCKDYSKM